MNFAERQSALKTVTNLIEACGPQTMTEIINELMIQATGCNNIHDAKDYAAYALRELKRSKVLEEDEIVSALEDNTDDTQTYYGLTYSS